jgi:hypothetical protein
MATFQIQAAAVNKPVAGRSVDLKMEALPRIRCIQ